MPDHFFTSPSIRKRKRPSSKVVNPQGIRQAHHTQKPLHRPSKKKQARDEELDSDHTDEGLGNDNESDRKQEEYVNEEEEEDYNETPAQKRLRLAQVYIESVKKDIQLGGY